MNLPLSICQVTNLKKMAKEGRGGMNELSELDFILPARMAAEPKEERPSEHQIRLLSL